MYEAFFGMEHTPFVRDVPPEKLYESNAFRETLGRLSYVADRQMFAVVTADPGCGKSTLIRHLTGVYRQDAGEIFIDGAPVYENKQVKAQMAYIPDEPFYFLQADTLEMMRYFRGMYESFDEKMFYRLQEFFPGIDMKRNIRRLSKGMQKQVAFWLALCCRPKLLILDEPFSALDPKHAHMIDDILKQLTDSGITVIIATHHADQAYRWADRIVVLNHSHVLADGTPQEIFSNKELLVAANLEQPTLMKVSDILKRKGILSECDFPKTAEELEMLLK